MIGNLFNREVGERLAGSISHSCDSSAARRKYYSSARR